MTRSIGVYGLFGIIWFPAACCGGGLLQSHSSWRHIFYDSQVTTTLDITGEGNYFLNIGVGDEAGIHERRNDEGKSG